MGYDGQGSYESTTARETGYVTRDIMYFITCFFKPDGSTSRGDF